ncbi:hypothetical protein WA026_016492 [Henosepilachna vigintioctopunctata]|uniref:Uncharacterized protein n=1 Tax=Henosepilachna vigintioctopunctata TaxID=420089 RepID=A0AAW1UD76_9CUCU
MARILKKNHYIASPRHNHTLIEPHRPRSTEYFDGEESQRGYWEKPESEYTSVPYHIENERKKEPKYENRENGYQYVPPPALSFMSRESGYDDGSEVYVTSGAYKAPSEMSSRYHPPSEYSPPSRRAPSAVSMDRRSYRKAGLQMDVLAAPNPFCPHAKGLCCLMLLFNLGIILVTLGFVIIIQFHDPIIVWILGIIFEIFGCLTLIGSLIYCVVIFREVRPPNDLEDIHWTHHWQKRIGTVPSESHYGTKERYPDDAQSDKYTSDHYSERISNKNSRY